MRLWLAVTVTALVWLVSTPAFAAAICDSRGATAFAPNPKLDEPVASLDLVAASPCVSSAQLALGIDQGHRTAADLDFSVIPACVPHASAIVRAHYERSPIAPDSDLGPVSADGDRHDRPPR